MFDCIAGYHLNPWTCGIAKFNTILARHMSLPVVGIGSAELSRYHTPLLSLKMSEFTADDARVLDGWAAGHPGGYELFLHAFDGAAIEQRLIAGAARVYIGNRELSAQLAPLRPDAVELFCPGTLLNPQRFQRTELSIFTFGMAHKIRVPLYRRLQELLDATQKSYSVYVSTALHENTSFDGSFVVRFEELQAIFNGQVYFMGYLSDTAGGLYVPRRVLRKGTARQQHERERRDGMRLRGDHQPRRVFARRAGAHEERDRHQRLRSAAGPGTGGDNWRGGAPDRARRLRVGPAGRAAAARRACLGEELARIIQNRRA
jgi:hypothetical protein